MGKYVTLFARIILQSIGASRNIALNGKMTGDK
jgi:hypothetical protein